MDEPNLGIYNGLPILKQSALIQKGNRVLSQTMDVAPFEVEPDGEIVMSMGLRQTRERWDNILSKDDGKLIGYERVVIFDATGAAPDDRPTSKVYVDKMRARVADKAEKVAQEKKGQVRLAGIDPVPEDDGIDPD